jgi:hypothetical protein
LEGHGATKRSLKPLIFPSKNWDVHNTLQKPVGLAEEWQDTLNHLINPPDNAQVQVIPSTEEDCEQQR